VSKQAQPTEDEIECMITATREVITATNDAARRLDVGDPRREALSAIAHSYCDAREGWKALRAQLYPPTSGVVVQLRRAR
jgi:hypothetical protein